MTVADGSVDCASAALHVAASAALVKEFAVHDPVTVAAVSKHGTLESDYDTCVT